MDTFEPSSEMGPIPTKVCHRCKEPIMDRYVMRVQPNYEFHPACLSCASCFATLDENSTCFVRNGIPYCKPDYFKFFGVHCYECKEVITDKVMKAGDKGYHVDCFKCTLCLIKLQPGDYYAIHNDKLHCKNDIEMLISDAETSSSPTDVGSPSSEEGSVSTISTNHGKQKAEKPPRVRTVLSEKQLRILKAVYSQSPKPDSLMKEHLCEVTGLSSRVIRVWFQNKRCKDKKKSIYDKAIEDAQLQSMGLPLSISTTPLTPGTPVTPDPMLAEVAFSVSQSIHNFSMSPTAMTPAAVTTQPSCPTSDFSTHTAMTVANDSPLS